MRISIIAATATVLLTGGASGAAEIEYLPIWPLRISGDGSTVIGTLNLNPIYDAFRWTEESGAVSIGRGGPRDVSYDGSIVVGYSRDEDYVGQSFRWSEETGMQPLSSTSENDYALRVSADGTMVVGDSRSYGAIGLNDSVAWRWTEESGIQELGGLPDYLGTFVRALSADGRVIVGTAAEDYPSLPAATRWTEDSGWANLGVLPGHRQSRAWDISADGSTVVGVSSASGRPDLQTWEVFRWTEETGMVGLGRTSGGETSAPLVSDDGEVITSSSFTGSGLQAQHLIWDEINGWRSFHDELRNDHGLEIDTSNSARYIVSDISADRRKIVGVRLPGPEPTSGAGWTGFLITLDTPLGPPILHGDYNKSGLVEQGDLDLVLSHWGEPASTAISGWRYDFPVGIVDQSELDAVLAGWGNTAASLTANATFAAVPEPSTVALLLIVGLAAVRRR